jgi:hypothetical protein
MSGQLLEECLACVTVAVSSSAKKYPAEVVIEDKGFYQTKTASTLNANVQISITDFSMHKICKAFCMIRRRSRPKCG